MDFFAMVQQVTAECARCGRKAMDLCQCPCRQVFYCDIQCQQDHWAIHKPHCNKGRRGRLPQSFCAYCSAASVNLKSCQCGAVYYCSLECQRKHFGTHRRTCTTAVTTFRRRRQQLVEEEDVHKEDDASTDNKEIQTDVTCTELLKAAKSARARAQKDLALERAGADSDPDDGMDLAGNDDLAFTSKKDTSGQNPLGSPSVADADA